MGLPLKTPCLLRVKPSGGLDGETVILHTAFRTLAVAGHENFTLGFGEELPEEYGKPTVPFAEVLGEISP